MRDSSGHGFLILLFLLTAVSGQTLAATDASTTEIFSTEYLIQVFGSLILVFGCLFGLIFLLKKMNGLPMGGSMPIRVIGSVKVGSREKILLLEAGEQQLLVGVAAGHINTLHTFPASLEGQADTSETQAPDFASLMKASSPAGGTS